MVFQIVPVSSRKGAPTESELYKSFLQKLPPYGATRAEVEQIVAEIQASKGLSKQNRGYLTTIARGRIRIATH